MMGTTAAGVAVSFATILCRAACLVQPGSTEQELGVAAGGLVHPDLLCATVVAAVMAGTGMVAMGGFARFGGEEPFKRVLDERGHGRGSRVSRLVVFVKCVVIILVAAAAAVVPVSAGAMMASVPALPASVAHGFLAQLPLSVQNSEQGGALPLLRSAVLVVSLRHDVLVRVTGRLEEQVLVLVAAGSVPLKGSEKVPMVAGQRWGVGGGSEERQRCRGVVPEVHPVLRRRQRLRLRLLSRRVERPGHGDAIKHKGADGGHDDQLDKEAKAMHGSVAVKPCSCLSFVPLSCLVE